MLSQYCTQGSVLFNCLTSSARVVFGSHLHPFFIAGGCRHNKHNCTLREVSGKFQDAGNRIVKHLGY